MQAVMETLFDIIYLTTVVILGSLMILKAKGNKQYLLFGMMAVVLGCGDAFHLVPRAIALCTTGFDDYVVSLGIGKMITSITMTVFYVILYYVWRIRYNVKEKSWLTAVIYFLAFIRITLCLLPQNEWTSLNTSLSWGVYRNIPFAIIGAMIIVMFYHSAKKEDDHNFRFMWLTILLSFGFYIPVVLWAEIYPMIGMLMIPKTCAYVWTILIGFVDMKSICLQTIHKTASV